jgi:dsDNA-specific endonuclease/ATPase MutS2
MTPRRQRRDGGPEVPKRGMRRSIRHEAIDTSVEDEAAPDLRREPGRPPEILLRKLKLVEALERLEFQMRAYASRGQAEVLVIHGKGQHSAGGVSVLGPEVRRWCDQHPALVVSWSEAPLRWGGAGVIVVRLRPQ